jgi:hypothetical protein
MASGIGRHCAAAAAGADRRKLGAVGQFLQRQLKLTRQLIDIRERPAFGVRFGGRRLWSPGGSGPRPPAPHDRVLLGQRIVGRPELDA